jgi:hypothetical protein
LVPEGAPVINSLNRQRAAIENILRACLALPPVNHMMLEHRLSASIVHGVSGTSAANYIGAPVSSPTKSSKPYVNGINGLVAQLDSVNGL